MRRFFADSCTLIADICEKTILAFSLSALLWEEYNRRLRFGGDGDDDKCLLIHSPVGDRVQRSTGGDKFLSGNSNCFWQLREQKSKTAATDYRIHDQLLHTRFANKPSSKVA